MSNDRLIIIFCFVCVIFIMSHKYFYGDEKGAEPTLPPPAETLPNGVSRFDDPHYRVTCWRDVRASSSSLFCIPSSELGER